MSIITPVAAAAAAATPTASTTSSGLKVQQDPVHIHDLHATILHLLGIDHKKLPIGIRAGNSV